MLNYTTDDYDMMLIGECRDDNNNIQDWPFNIFTDLYYDEKYSEYRFFHISMVKRQFVVKLYSNDGFGKKKVLKYDTCGKEIC